MSEDFITKIEGHGRLKADWRKNKIVFEIHEGERLFEGLLVGRPATEAAWITARICGVCPIAHNLCAFKAIEDALGIAPDETTVLLRRLLIDGQMIQSHALHFYFLSLPDYLGIDSGLEIKSKHPKYFKAALTLKEISDKIAEIVGGRSTHPTTTTIGGFYKTPSASQLKQIRKRLKEEAFPAAESTARLAIQLEYPSFETDLNLLSQISEKGHFNVYESPRTQGDPSTIRQAHGGPSTVSSGQESKSWPAAKYKKMITEEIRESSTAKLGFHQGKPAMVGSLARIGIQGKKLNRRARRLLAQSKICYRNPFHNNIAQAIEIVHFVEEAIKLTDQLLQTSPTPLDLQGLQERKLQKLEGPETGIGALEAPRGGLYHEYTIDKKGLITSVNIITPTVQNLGSLETVAQALADQTRGLKNERRERLILMLIRAYDPCITCSVH